MILFYQDLACSYDSLHYRQPLNVRQRQYLIITFSFVATCSSLFLLLQIKNSDTNETTAETDDKYCAKLLNGKNPNCIRMSVSEFQPSIAATFTWQRLGNQLSAFATLYSLWKRFGIYNYINTDQLERLSDVFDLPEAKSGCINDWPYFVWEPSKFKLNSNYILD